jgi:hypothetical protein
LLRSAIARNGDRDHIGGSELMLVAQVEGRLDRGLRGAVAGIALQHGIHHEIGRAEPAGELRHVVLVAEDAQEAELALDHARGSGEALLGEARGQNAAFSGAAQMEALDHGAVARIDEFQEAAGARARNAEYIGHLAGIEPVQVAGRDGGPERTGGTGRMETAGLVGVLGGVPDPKHDLGAGHHGGDERTAAIAALLGDREAGSEQRRRRMCPAVGFGRAIEFEGMRQRAVGERSRGRLHARPVDAEDHALAAGAVALRMGDDHPAPRQLRAVADGRHAVDDAVLGALHDSVGQVLVAQRRRIGGKPFGLVGGFLLARGGRRLGRCRAGAKQGGRERSGARHGRHLLEKCSPA